MHHWSHDRRVCIQGGLHLGGGSASGGVGRLPGYYAILSTSRRYASSGMHSCLVVCYVFSSCHSSNKGRIDQLNSIILVLRFWPCLQTVLWIFPLNINYDVLLVLQHSSSWNTAQVKTSYDIFIRQYSSMHFHYWDTQLCGQKKGKRDSRKPHTVMYVLDVENLNHWVTLEKPVCFRWKYYPMWNQNLFSWSTGVILLIECKLF